MARRPVEESEKIRLTDDQWHQVLAKLVVQDEKAHVDRELSAFARIHCDGADKKANLYTMLDDFRRTVVRRLINRSPYPVVGSMQREWRGGKDWTYFEDTFTLDRLFVFRYHGGPDKEIIKSRPPTFDTTAIILQRPAAELEARVEMLKQAMAMRTIVAPKKFGAALPERVGIC